MTSAPLAQHQRDLLRAMAGNGRGLALSGHAVLGDGAAMDTAAAAAPFELAKVEYAWEGGGKLVAMVVRNNVLVMAIEPRRLQRIDLARPEVIEGRRNVNVFVGGWPLAVSVTRGHDTRT